MSLQQPIDQLDEAIEATKTIQVTSYKTDDARFRRNRTASDRARRARSFSKPVRVHAIVEDEKSIAVFGRKPVALPARGRPGEDVIFQVEQIHRIAGSAPLKIRGRCFRPRLLRQVVGARMDKIVE